MRHVLLTLSFVVSAAACAKAEQAPRAAGSGEPRPAAADSLPRPRWYQPHHLIGQYAGGQGLATIGAGYTVLHRRLDLDVLAGYVPQRYSVTAMGIFTAKATYSPWNLALGTTSWRIRPLSVGGLVNYTASSGLNKTRDSKYSKGYYWWSAHTRLGAFVGGRVTYQLPLKAHRRPHALSLYYELGTNDLYFVSLATNVGALPLADILTLGIGAKFDLW
jgi:hypothetical protein